MTDGVIAIKEIPLWEKVTWTLIGLYLIIVLYVYWVIGWSNLAFPL